MGAKNCPETPRQKMIGMMYLVLTAMLALNVSNEVLNGFDMVNSGLGKSIESAAVRNEGMYNNFDEEALKNPAKVKEWLDKAKVVKAESDALVKHIQAVKSEIVKIADGKKADPKAETIINRENIDAAGQFALGNGDDKLKAEIEKYRDFIVQTTKDDAAKQEMFRKMFDTKGGFGKTWSASMFESMPVAAVVTMLTKYQSDIRTAESETVQYLRAKADLQQFTITKLQAFIIPESNYVLQGGVFNATIVLSAEDTTNNKSYKYFLNGSSLSGNKIQIGASGIGPHTISATVQVPLNTGKSGETRSYTASTQYTVGKPSATLSNVDLNVVYRGIDNRFRISVPGIADGNVRVSANGATVGRAGDFYIVKPQQDGEITLSVTANINGKTVNMGSEKYRVKYLPNPTAYFQYTDGGGVPRLAREEKLSKRLLKNGSGIVANYGEDALIDAKFTVTSFTLSALGTSIPTSGSKFNARQVTLIDELEGGDDVFIKNIKAVGPDGRERKLGTISIQL